LLLALVTQLGVGSPAAQSLNTNLHVTDGTVRAVAVAGGLVYVGGTFERVGPATGGGAPISLQDAGTIGTPPPVAGTVNAVAPDGLGGWYIGGTFTSVGGIPRSNIAHIPPRNTVDSGNPAANRGLIALA